MQKKSKHILILRKDEPVNDLFVVRFKKPVEPYKNGYKFELRLGDSSGEIMYKYWGSTNELSVRQIYDSIKKDDVVLVKGRVNEWNNALEISANDSDSITVINPEDYDKKEFVKSTKKDVNKLWSELEGFISEVKDEEISKILHHFFDNKEFAKKFRESPAAMYRHHGWISGLLEHTVSALRIGQAICSVHQQLDRDLVIAGIIFHDVGKIDELCLGSSIRVTTEGMLLGHVTIAINMLDKAAREIGMSENKRLKFLHIILTHMGEYGSSKKPSFPEALAVYFADQADAHLTEMLTLKEEASTEDDCVYNKDYGNIYLK